MTTSQNRPARRGARLLSGGAVGALAVATLAFAPTASAAPVAQAGLAERAVAGVTAPAVLDRVPAARAGRPATTVRTNQELRRAVRQANARSGSDSIVIAGTINFPRGASDIVVSDNLRIDGQGKLIDAKGRDRVFDVTSGTRLIMDRVRIRGGAPASGESGGAIRSQGTVVLRNGAILASKVVGEGASGGAIMNDGGSVVVINSRLASNSAVRAGGAIEANGGTTTVRESRMTRNSTGAGPGNGGALHITGEGAVRILKTRVAFNTAAAEGGGLWNSADGTMVVRGSDVLNNTAAGNDADQGGGGLYNDGGDLTVSRTEVDENLASGTSGSGGGILNNLGNVLVEESVLTDNVAQRAGGAIEANMGRTTVTTSKLDRNRAGANPGNGGAVHITGAGNVIIAASSVTNNVATAEGGGLWNSAIAVMTVSNSVVSGNSAAGDDADQGGGGIYGDGGPIRVDNSTIELNEATGTAGSGGGILSKGALQVTETTVGGNEAVRAGGGIEMAGNDVEVRRSQLNDNTVGSAPGNGGGLHITGATDALVANSAVTGNTAVEGGGLWNNAGTMTVRLTEFADNEATGPDATNGGGALYNEGGTVDVSTSTFDDNDASGTAGSGGGILNAAGTLSVEKTTFDTNDATRAGGAIETFDGPVQLTDVDMTGNTTGAAPGNGGGVHNGGAGTVVYSGGVVTGNTAANEGGGLWNSATGTFTATNVAANSNTAPTGPNVYTQPGGVFTINGQVVPAGQNAIATTDGGSDGSVDDPAAAAGDGAAGAGAGN